MCLRERNNKIVIENRLFFDNRYVLDGIDIYFKITQGIALTDTALLTHVEYNIQNLKYIHIHFSTNAMNDVNIKAVTLIQYLVEGIRVEHGEEEMAAMLSSPTNINWIVRQAVKDSPVNAIPHPREGEGCGGRSGGRGVEGKTDTHNIYIRLDYAPLFLTLATQAVVNNRNMSKMITREFQVFAWRVIARVFPTQFNHERERLKRRNAKIKTRRKHHDSSGEEKERSRQAFIPNTAAGRRDWYMFTRPTNDFRKCRSFILDLGTGNATFCSNDVHVNQLYACKKHSYKDKLMENFYTISNKDRMRALVDRLDHQQPAKKRAKASPLKLIIPTNNDKIPLFSNGPEIPHQNLPEQRTILSFLVRTTGVTPNEPHPPLEVFKVKKVHSEVVMNVLEQELQCLELDEDKELAFALSQEVPKKEHNILIASISSSLLDDPVPPTPPSPTFLTSSLPRLPRVAPVPHVPLVIMIPKSPPYDKIPLLKVPAYE